MKHESRPLWIGCIADDFTGGSDAASFLKKAGLETFLVNGEALRDDIGEQQPEALVIALKSRSIPAGEAVEQTVRAAKWLLERGARHLYFKYCSTFDSTPQGNIGPVIDALLSLTGEAYTVLCPSLPVNGRTVQNGILYVNGVPLAESPMRSHPINPMWSSSLPELMAAQSIYPCVVLTERQMRLKAPTESYHMKGPFTVVPPYRTDEDGRRIAEKFGGLRLLTGGSGLLEHLGRWYLSGGPDRSGHPAPPAKLPSGPRLFLAGSCSVQTQRQVQIYLEHGGQAICLEPDKLLAGIQTEESLRDAIAGAGEDLLLYSTAGAEQVQRYQAAGPQRVSALLEGLMGRLAVYGREQGFRRIVVAGGETSGAVMKALGSSVYRIGPNAAPGVPAMYPIDQPQLCLVLKSGNFGDENFFLTALNEKNT